MPPPFYPCCALLLLLFIGGCQPATNNPVDTGVDYFPLEPGRYVIYNVEEQHYALNALPVQRSYQLKEVIGPAYTDVTGQTAYSLRRYRRAVETQPWQADSLWSAHVTATEAIRTENGRDLVKLVFPVSDQLRWNGNRRNTLGEDEYEIRNNDKPFRVLTTQYDRTVTVVAQDDSTLLARDKRMEVYARQVGLIHKERTQLVYCSSEPACVGKNQIAYGIRQLYRLHSSGQE